MASALQHHQLERDNVSLHFVSQGEGPLVIFAHGFPGLWYSWREQLPALAAAGYRAVALDMRGYGRSSRPQDSAAYHFDELAKDLLAVQDYFAVSDAVLVGHDFGANLTWHMGLHYPERISAIVVLASPRGMPLAGGGDTLPSTLFARVAEQHFFHMHYFQTVGLAEADLAGVELEFLERLFWALSASGNLLDWTRYPSGSTTYLDVLAKPSQALPWSWMSQEDFDYYCREYMSTGGELVFAGGLNSYRAMDTNWQSYQTQLLDTIHCPALFLAGAEDPVIKLCDPEVFSTMRDSLADLRGEILIPAAGHFVQQEQPEESNRVLIDFLQGL